MIRELPTINDSYRINAPQLDMPPRLLLGPGPSNAHPRVLQAISMRQVGHLDPTFIDVMNEVQDLLRYAWQTENSFTLPISGTGSAAMEAAVANLVEPGDVVLIGVIGYFGERIVEMARRYGADVRVIEKNWGEAFTTAELYSALEEHRPKILALVHGETSTGVVQPLADVGDLCREFFLDLETPCKGLDDTGQFADADHLVARQVTDVGNADDWRHVMFAV